MDAGQCGSLSRRGRQRRRGRHGTSNPIWRTVLVVEVKAPYWQISARVTGFARRRKPKDGGYCAAVEAFGTFSKHEEARTVPPNLAAGRPRSRPTPDLLGGDDLAGTVSARADCARREVGRRGSPARPALKAVAPALETPPSDTNRARPPFAASLGDPAASVFTSPHGSSSCATRPATTTSSAGVFRPRRRSRGLGTHRPGTDERSPGRGAKQRCSRRCPGGGPGEAERTERHRDRAMSRASRTCGQSTTNVESRRRDLPVPRTAR